jgi:hypothetical protein
LRLYIPRYLYSRMLGSTNRIPRLVAFLCVPFSSQVVWSVVVCREVRIKRYARNKAKAKAKAKAKWSEHLRHDRTRAMIKPKVLLTNFFFQYGAE